MCFKRKAVIALAVMLMVIPTASCHMFKKGSPIVLTLWHYYNGAQYQVFDDLITEFNETEGAQKGIVIEPYHKGSISDLNKAVTASSQRVINTEAMPDIFSCYADSARYFYDNGTIVDFSEYLNEQMRSLYIDSYIKEADFSGNGSAYVFPVAKSSEVLIVNMTDWQPFADSFGFNEESFSTVEGICEMAEKYYEYTSDLGEAKSFFGRDAMANYMIVGAMQLGCEIFPQDTSKGINLDKAAIKTLWDNYYKPFVNGYFGAYGHFRSDDIKTGDVIAFVGSTSSAAYFPGEVTRIDGSTYGIEAKVFPMPVFKNGEKYAIQQGAGMAVSKSTEERQRAAVDFLRWFTKPENNLRFTLSAGYMPVQRAANDKEILEQAFSGLGISTDSVLYNAITVSMDMTNEYAMYSPNSALNVVRPRSVLGNSIDDISRADRERVIAAMDSPENKKKLLETFMSDDYFERWYEKFKSEVEGKL